MPSLRSRVIKLAHDEPSLRPALLPVLAASSDEGEPLDYPQEIAWSVRGGPTGKRKIVKTEKELDKFLKMLDEKYGLDAVEMAYSKAE